MGPRKTALLPGLGLLVAGCAAPSAPPPPPASAPEVELAPAFSGMSADIGDYDNDGDLDLHISASTKAAHFGLGDRAAVDLPEARWPGGTADRMRDVPADRCVTVVEGRHPG